MYDSKSKTLADLKEGFSSLYQERLDQLFLFGSQARGTAETDSDMDLLVVLKGEVNPNDERANTLDLIADLSLDNDTVISCVFMDSDSFANKQGPLLRNIRREGVLL